MSYPTVAAEKYTPLYFLNAVGAGGIAVSFFMYLMWLTPRPGQPIPTFASIAAAWAEGPVAMKALILFALSGIAFFIAQHARLLIWNLRQAGNWKRSPAYQAFRRSNGETQLMAQPLALAMSVNVGFIAGAVFVPGLWDVRELLFPLAIVAFAAIGVHAMRLHLAFFARVLGEGGFDCAKNNNLGQMLGVFAHAMVGVGLSASAAMSHTPATVIVAYIASALFLAASAILGTIMLVLGFRAMMEHGAAEETTPTLWIMIPILTVGGIGVYRLKMALAHNFGATVHASEVFALLTVIVTAQLVFGALGWAVMSRVGYARRWVFGAERSAGSYALVCPGVALTVSGFFLLNAGIVKLGVVDPYATAHLALHVPLVGLQLATIWLYLKLNRKLLQPTPDLVQPPPSAARAG